MADIEQFQERFYSQLSKLKSSFEAIAVKFESGHLDDAVRLSGRLLSEIKVMVGDLTANYAAGLEQRMTAIGRIQEKISVLAEKKQDDLSRDGCLNLILDLKKSIRTIEREVKFQYVNPIIIPLLKRISRQILIVLSAFLILAGVNKVRKEYQMRKFGLTGQYYEGMNFDRYVRTRIDRQIHFDWGGKSPMIGISENHFSVRWEGYIVIPRPGNYEFCLGSDDGSRLWIDDQKIIDDWRTHKYTSNRKMIPLTSGNHKIELEYFQNGNYAGIDLSWRLESDPNLTTIPYENFIPNQKFLETR